MARPIAALRGRAVARRRSLPRDRARRAGLPRRSAGTGVVDRHADAPSVPAGLGRACADELGVRLLPGVWWLAVSGGNPRTRRRSASSLRILRQRLAHRVAALSLLWRERSRKAGLPGGAGPPGAPWHRDMSRARGLSQER